MQKYARIQDGLVAEIIDFNPSGLFHADLVWAPCPDGVGQQWSYDGVGFLPPEVPTPLPNPDPSGLLYAKTAKQAEITAKCDAALAPLATEYGVYERATWDQQSAEAKALAANPEADAPLVRAMATARDIDVVELANRILGHEARWKAVAGAVIGQRQALWDRVDAITGETPDAVAAVQAIEVVYSLPEV